MNDSERLNWRFPSYAYFTYWASENFFQREDSQYIRSYRRSRKFCTVQKNILNTCVSFRQGLFARLAVSLGTLGNKASEELQWASLNYLLCGNQARLMKWLQPEQVLWDFLLPCYWDIIRNERNTSNLLRLKNSPTQSENLVFIEKIQTELPSLQVSDTSEKKEIPSMR